MSGRYVGGDFGRGFWFGGGAGFGRLIAAARSERAAIENGSITVIDAPADPDLLTVRTVRALQMADVIVFDGRVSPEVLNFARREARKLPVGEAGVGPARNEYEVDALTAALARQGKRVVRLKSSQAAAAATRVRPRDLQARRRSRIIGRP